MVGAATAGLFATIVVGSHVYGVISPLAGVSASLLVGALATALAIRWAGHAIAGVGLIGALLSPLVLVRAVVEAPPSSLFGDQPALPELLAVATLAASCLASGYITAPRARWLGDALNALGFAAIAYLTAQALSGPMLAAAWALEALAVLGVSVSTHSQQARYAGAAFMTLSLGHALILEAPPAALVTGAPNLLAAAKALGAIALALLARSRVDREARRWLIAGGVATLLYLASIAIVTAFQPAAGSADIALRDLSIRQEGQVLLSGFWSLVGVAGLIVGLRTNNSVIRNGALGLLLATIAKVFLYDLSTLTSIYRVISFIALGLLLLAGAFAYQRLRPPPLPDMRKVHRTQR